MSILQIIALLLLWTAWCALHSILIAQRVMEHCEKKLPQLCKYHRLIFNFVSIVSFYVVVLFEKSLPNYSLFQFEGSLNRVRIGFLVCAVLLFVVGGLSYDMFHFLGLRQLFSSRKHRVLTKSGEFKADGLLRLIRHPWYLAAIILIWSRSQSVTTAELVTDLVFTLYLIIGTVLEERKLVRQFGEHYRQYQQEVSMLFPAKWIMKLSGTKNRF